MESKNNFNNNNGKWSPFKFRSFGLFAAMFWAFLFAMILSNGLSPYFTQIINGLFSGLTPLLFGMIIAFVFYRLVDFTEKVVLKNAFLNSPYKFIIKRTISLLIVLLIIASIVLLVFSILVPRIVEIIQRLTAGDGDGGNQIYHNVVNEISNLIQKWFGTEVPQDSIQNILNYIFDQFMQAVGYLDNLLELSISVVIGLFNIFIGLVLAFFMLKDKEKISRFFRRYTYANFKKERADELCVLTNNANKILNNYVVCKLIEFAMLFVSLGVVFTFLGLEFTWELALIIGVFNFIPYFGIYIGTIPAILITLIFNSMDAALYLALATFIVTTVEFNTLLPIIIGNRLKISALLVAGSIIIGGAMFGIGGMLFAPPIIAIISAIVMGNIEMKENRMKYIMELNAAREKNMKAEQEQLGIVEKHSQIEPVVGIKTFVEEEKAKTDLKETNSKTYKAKDKKVKNLKVNSKPAASTKKSKTAPKVSLKSKDSTKSKKP